MSSIKFDASLNIEKLYEELKKANQSFDEFSKKGEQAGENIDKSFQKSTVNIKQQLALQKQYVKELTDEIARLEKAREGTSGSQRSNINREIGNLRSDLNKETAIMQNLQKQSVESNQKEEKSQGGLIQSLGKWALGLASVGAAMKIAHKIIESTESAAHLFETGINAASSATGVFFKTVASGDWGNFFSNMDQAIKGAIAYTNAIEDLQNRANQVKISGSKLDIKIGELRQKTYEQADDPIELKKTLTELVGVQREKLTEEAKIATDTYKIKAKKIADDNGWNVKELQQTIEFYSEKKDIIHKGEEYNRLLAIKFQQGGSGGVTMISSGGNEVEYKKAQAQLKIMKEEAAITGLNLEQAGKLADAFGKVTFKERDLVADLLAKSNTAEAAININNRRDNQRIANIDKQIAKDNEAAAKKAKEDAELDNRIKATQELMKTASGERLKQLAAEYLELVKQKNLNDQLIDQAIKLARNPDGTVVPALMRARGGKVTDTTIKGITGLGKSTWTDLPLAQATAEQLEKQKKLRGEILNASLDLTHEMGIQLGLSEEEQGILDNSLNAIGQLASGNYVGAALSAIMAISDGIAKIIDGGNSDERANRIERINDLLEEQYAIVQKSVREGQQQEARQKELDTLKEKSIQLIKNQTEAEDKLSKSYKAGILLSSTGIIGILGVLKARKKLKEEISATSEEVKELERQIKEAEQELLDFQSQGITQNTLADSIAQAFEDGKGSVKDFGDYTNDILREAVMTAFKANILGETLTKAQKQIASAFEDKSLSKKEIEDIKSTMQAATTEAKSQWDQLTGSFPEMFAPDEASKQLSVGGTIRREITEATGTELAGLLRRGTDDTRIIRDYTKMGITHLTNIEANTFETVVQLKRAVVELQSIVSNTKPAYTGKI